MKKEINLSVHGLVDFLLRKGDIDNRIYNQSSMQEGSRIHLRYQQIQDGSYLSEQELSIELEVRDFKFTLHGRADGIIKTPSMPIIDEIKSTVDELEHFHEVQEEWHLGQAKTYAFIYGKMNNINRLGVRLTYISQKDFDDKLVLNYNYSLEELEKYVRLLCEKYLDFYQNIYQHNQLKIESAKKLAFPYPYFRQGQKELAKYVYGTIKKGETLFVEAPTGIGKTMSTLFPAVKSFASLDTEKIFYLSAKTVAKNVAYEASKKLISNGLIARSIKLQSKEKMCRMDARKCNPDDCPFARGYYDKIKSALEDVLENNALIDEEIVNAKANELEICPFEFQLDISLYCDIIICDYNYFFDPFVYLKRFFDASYMPYVALVDESHNLVDRSKEMYTCVLDLSAFEQMHRDFKRFKVPKLKRYLKKIMTNLQSHLGEEEYVLVNNEFDLELHSALENFFKQGQDLLKNMPELAVDSFLECFRQVNRFIKMSDFINENFCCYYEIDKENRNVKAVIRCVDSSEFIKNSVSILQAAVFFSATLSPLEYYKASLGASSSTPSIILDSPFDKNNLLKIVRGDISTRYKDREYSYEEIARTIENAVSKKKGNYLVFFSSYSYLENVYKFLNENKEINYIKQVPEMLDKERDAFLANFNEENEKTTVGLAVLGGAFSEGIDLTGDKLIGAIIVGVGLPQISFERDIIRSHYDNKELNGYDFAYVYPGMNKVLQAAGRVIRTEEDKGFVIFIDDRFRTYKYQALMRQEYDDLHYCSSNTQIGELIEDFWSKHNS